MFLIYINEIGIDYKNQKQYEFIFSKSEEFQIDEWFQRPASSVSMNKLPDLSYINLVGVLKNSDLDLELIQNSDCFAIIDAVDGVVSLAWEKFDEMSENKRLFFTFGEKIDEVKTKLQKRGLSLINDNFKNLPKLIKIKENE